MKYVSKRVEIEAVRVTDVLASAERDWRGLPDWIEDAYNRGDVILEPHRVNLKLGDIWQFAQRGEWIIRGSKGGLYPCDTAKFERQWEPA